MDTLYGILLVFAVSFLELWAGIPLGFALKLNPVITGTVAALGSICAAFVVSFIGEEFREKVVRWRYGKNKDLKRGTLYKIWNRYGTVYQIFLGLCRNFSL